jgi:hypothetical protein
MKKNYVLGILAIVFTVISCYFVYHKFWAALIGFGISAIALPAAVYLIKPRFVWFSIPLAVVLDLILYWPEYNYYEARGLFIFVTFLQIIVMAVEIMIIKFESNKLEADS